jgi:hypothetical protein
MPLVDSLDSFTLNHQTMRLLKKMLVVVLALGIVLSSCKKDELIYPKSPQPNQSGQSSDLQKLLSLKEVPKEIKSSLELTDYSFKTLASANEVWMVALKMGTKGFKHSKIIVVAQANDVVFRLLSYDYNDSTYQRGNFKTFTGTITTFDKKFKKIGSMKFKNGVRYDEGSQNCPTCSIVPAPMPALEPGDPYIDWCSIMPSLCHSGGDGSGGGGSDNQGLEPPGDGGGDCNCYPQVIINLSSLLPISDSQKDWLTTNYNRAFEIYNYLQTTTQASASRIAMDHLNAMMNSSDYLNFVVRHVQNGDPSKIWWEDIAWVNDHNNFSLNIDNVPVEPDLTAAEWLLILQNPAAAALVSVNRGYAEQQTVARFGNNGINDRSDAFRHCFFAALNTLTWIVGADLARRFAEAHETGTLLPRFQLEFDMDTFNNNVGINYGQGHSSLISLDHLGQDIMGLVNNGTLRHLRPLTTPQTDQNFWNADENLATHGIIFGTTQMVPTNQ